MFGRENDYKTYELLSLSLSDPTDSVSDWERPIGADYMYRYLINVYYTGLKSTGNGVVSY